MKHLINRLLRWVYKLSWKRIAGFGLFGLMLAAIPITINVANSPTRTESKAALLPRTEPISTKFETPSGPPEIYLVDHFFGKVGDSVLIHGKNLGGLHNNSSISLGGQKIKEENLVSWTGDFIEFIVPKEAKSGLIEVNILGNRRTWPGMFFVVDQNTKTELNFNRNANDPIKANLEAVNINGAKEILIWLLAIKNDKDLKILPNNGITTESNIINLPIGKVYEIKLQIPENLARNSVNQPISLIQIIKQEKQTVGLARAEISLSNGILLPVKSNPLYVSF